jgi:hypothetical protein
MGKSMPIMMKAEVYGQTLDGYGKVFNAPAPI